jgi:hypothetical protein
MAFDTTNPVSEDNATKADDYDVVFDNTIALKEGRNALTLGGDPHAAVTDTSFVDVPGAVHFEIDGTNLSGLTVAAHFQCVCESGTGTFRLYNVTTAGAVASSEKTFTNNTSDRAETSTLTLTTGVNEYKAQVKGSVAACLPRIWGAAIVIT